jgi:hypothetical protein
MRVIVGLSVAAASVAFLASPGVRAQERAEGRLNQQGRFSVGAERLFGVAYQTTTIEQGGVKETLSTTSVSLLTKPNASPITAPRIAFDYFAIDGLSVGMGIGYSTISNDATLEGVAGAQVGGGRGVHAFVVAPRVGYAYMFNEYVGLWPRLGMTYSLLSSNGDQANDVEVSSHSLAVSGEVPLVFTPVSHVAFLLAPTIDYGVSAAVDVTLPNSPQQSVDNSPLDIGLHAGLAVWF